MTDGGVVLPLMVLLMTGRDEDNSVTATEAGTAMKLDDEMNVSI